MKSDWQDYYLFNVIEFLGDVYDCIYDGCDDTKRTNLQHKKQRQMFRFWQAIFFACKDWKHKQLIMFDKHNVISKLINLNYLIIYYKLLCRCDKKSI